MIPKKRVGLAQRFLFAFGGDADPAPSAYNNLLEEIALPIVRYLFTLIVRRVGPRVTQATEPYVVCSAAQSEVVAEAENIFKLHNRRHGVLETLRSAMPKGMYWLGTSILLNTTVGNLWRVALKMEVVDHIPTEVPDGAFASAMRFMHTLVLSRSGSARGLREGKRAGRGEAVACSGQGSGAHVGANPAEAVQAPTLLSTASKASISNSNEICARLARRHSLLRRSAWRSSGA